MDRFDTFAALLNYPMYIVTALAEEERAGCLVGFAGQCSIQPSRFTVWISKANRTYDVASRSQVLLFICSRAIAMILPSCSAAAQATMWTSSRSPRGRQDRMESPC